MQKLPAEILTEIASCLCLQNQLSCLLVCRHWYHAISGTTLFRHLFIDDSNIQQALKYFEDKTRSNVHNLSISTRNSTSLTFMQDIPIIFSNVQYLKWHFADDELLYDAAPFAGWSESLRKLTDAAKATLTRTLLTNYTCNNLTTLSVSFEMLDLTSRNVLQEMLNSLHQAPHLKILTLLFAPIKLDDLDQINKTLKLDSLSLNYFKPALDDSYYDCSAASDNDIKSLQINFSRFPQELTSDQMKATIYNWTRYIGCNYGKLETIFMDWLRKDTRLDGVLDEQPLLQTLEKLTSLKVYHINIYPISENVVNTLHNALTGLTLYAENDAQVHQEFTSIKASKATCDIANLEIHCYNVENMNLNAMFRQLSCSTYIYQLTELKLMFDLQSNRQNIAAFFLDILATIKGLQKFHIDSVNLDENDFASEDWIESRLNIASTTQLRDLNLMIYFENEMNDRQLSILQRFLNLICTCCQSSLRSFTLGGDTLVQESPCILTLDLSHMCHLVDFTCNLSSPVAYQFQNNTARQGKLYRNYHKTCTEQEIDAWTDYYRDHGKLFLNIELNEKVDRVELWDLLTR